MSRAVRLARKTLEIATLLLAFGLVVGVGAAEAVPGANDAPVLDITKSPALDPTWQNAAAPSGVVGTLVSALVDFASPAGQGQPIDLKLVSRQEFGSGAVAMRYEPRR